MGGAGGGHKVYKAARHFGSEFTKICFPAGDQPVPMDARKVKQTDLFKELKGYTKLKNAITQRDLLKAGEESTEKITPSPEMIEIEQRIEEKRQQLRELASQKQKEGELVEKELSKSDSTIAAEEDQENSSSSEQTQQRRRLAGKVQGGRVSAPFQRLLDAINRQ